MLNFDQQTHGPDRAQFAQIGRLSRALPLKNIFVPRKHVVGVSFPSLVRNVVMSTKLNTDTQTDTEFRSFFVFTQKINLSFFDYTDKIKFSTLFILS